MKRRELEKHEEEARELIEQLEKLSSASQTSPDFLSKVMEKADRLPPPRKGFLGWLALWLRGDFRIGALALTACLAVLVLGPLAALKKAWDREQTMVTQIVALREEVRKQGENLRALQGEQERASLELDLSSLKRRIWQTDAIGFLTKLSLRNQFDDLLDHFRGFHSGNDSATLDGLRERYNLMLLKMLTLIQDDDPDLLRDILASREILWKLFVDPVELMNL